MNRLLMTAAAIALTACGGVSTQTEIVRAGKD